jgi:type I restriction enzyme S subunit
VSWSRQRVKWLATEVRHTVDPAAVHADDVFHYSIPSLDDYGDGTVEPVGDIGSSKLLLRGGEVLVSKLNPRISRVLTASQHVVPTLASTEFIALIPGPDLDSRFFCYWLQSETARQFLDGATMSVTRSQQRVRPDILTGSWLSVPVVSRQRAIAAYLDRETVRIDALVAAKQRMVDLLEEQFAVARIDLVIGASQTHRRSGPEWLGSIPADWAVKRLKFVAHMESGHTPNKQIDAYWIDCTIPWITLNDVSDLEQDWRFSNPKNAVNELGLQNSSAHVLPANAVVLSRDATVGRSALLDRPMAVSQHFVAWVCGPELMPEYLLNVVRGPMQHHFGSLTAGATIATIGMPDLNQLVVPLPSMEEQAQIVERIAAAERLASKTISTVTAQIKVLQERRQALITAVVTGQLEIPEAA